MARLQVLSLILLIAVACFAIIGNAGKSSRNGKSSKSKQRDASSSAPACSTEELEDDERYIKYKRGHLKEEYADEGGRWSYGAHCIGAYAIKGDRAWKPMQDRFSVVTGGNIMAFGVFDGHGGSEAADMASTKLVERIAEAVRKQPDSADDETVEKIIVDVVEKFDAEMPNDTESSSTAAIAVIRTKNRKPQKLYLAIVGDCDAVVKYASGVTEKFYSHHIIEVGPPPRMEEFSRVVQANGKLTATMRGWRMPDGLFRTRALGDRVQKAKGNWLIATPAVGTIDLNETTLEYIILATDGFWKVVGHPKLLTQDIDENGYIKRQFRGAGVLAETAYDVYKNNKKKADDITVAVAKFGGNTCEMIC